MIDADLAELYQVDTKRLNEQVKRNPDRFPNDFMFQLTAIEWTILKSQFATSRLWGGRRTRPFVFTEHGVLMLSSLLSSQRAVAVNIQIMRVYVKVRQLLQTDQELGARMEELEQMLVGTDEKVNRIFEYFKEIVGEKEQPRTRVGYKSQRSVLSDSVRQQSCGRNLRLQVE